MVKKEKSNDEKDDDKEEKLDSGPFLPFDGSAAYPEVEAIFRQFEEMVKAIMSSFGMMEEGPWRPHSNVYGFSITIGPDGKPRVRQFGPGHVRGSRDKVREVKGDIPVDVVEGKDSVEVVALVGPVKEGDIDVIVDGRKLVIVHKKWKFMKQVMLPFKVESKPAKLEIRNGVLTATFKRKRLLPL